MKGNNRLCNIDLEKATQNEANFEQTISLHGNSLTTDRQTDSWRDGQKSTERHG